MDSPKLARRAPRYRRKNPASATADHPGSVPRVVFVAEQTHKEAYEMAVLRARRNRRKRKGITSRRAADVRATPETDFKGPNVNKRHRKADEIYGDISIPDSARKE